MGKRDDDKRNDAAESGRIGGLVRARSLTPEQRSEIARMAAVARWKGKKKKILRATYTGEIKNVGARTPLPCAVLEDGRRVLSQRGLWSGLSKGKASPTGWSSEGTDVELPPFLRSKSLKPFISEELTLTLTNPILYKGMPKGGGEYLAHGIPAESVADVLDVWLKARDAGALHYTQMPIAEKADILMRSLAKIGITALIDEATGFQYQRTRDALSQLLEKYIAAELARWVKTFPDEFYRQMFRLRGWQYEDNSTRRPGAVGGYTNDFVYNRIAPELLDELQQRNPRLPSGRLKYKNFQWLTQDFGHPRLREHIEGVTALMKAHDDWDKFIKILDRVYPRMDRAVQLDFGFQDNDEEDE